MKKILPILLLFVSVAVFSQEKAPTNKELKEQIERLSSDLKDSNQKYALEIKELEARERDLYTEYSGITKDHVEDLRDRVTLYSWLISLVVTLVSLIVGVIIPILITVTAKKDVEKTKKEIDEYMTMKMNVIEQTKKDSDTALKAINQIKKIIENQASHINELKEKIQKSEKETSQFAKQAEASTLFSEALNETDHDKKIALYTKAIELNPDYASAYNNRGVAYDNIEDYNNAIVDYTKAIELKPVDTSTYNNRGVAYDNMKDYNNAIVDYTKAIELKPDDADAYYNRGESYRSLETIETDSNKKTEYIKLAEKDVKKYKELAEGEE